MKFSELNKIMWERMTNPLTMITRLILFILFLIAVWHHHWVWIWLLMIALIINPFIFPPPKNEVPWISKVVRGIRIWMENSDKGQQLILYAVGMLIFLFLLWSIWNHFLFLGIVFFLLILAFKAVFLMFALNIANDYPEDKPGEEPSIPSEDV